MSTANRCANCGAVEVRTEPLALASAVRLWVGTGGPLIREAEVCAACGSQSYGTGRTGMYRRQRRRIRQLPATLLRVVLRRRTAQPVPAIYLGAVGVGTVVSGLLRVTVSGRWWSSGRWWLGVGIAPALTWLVFLATAFSRRFEREPLWVELRASLDPAWGAERRQREQDDGVRSFPLPLYRPVDWEGHGFVAGSSGQPGGHLSSVSLGFVHDWAQWRPSLEIRTSDPDDPRGWDLPEGPEDRQHRPTPETDQLVEVAGAPVVFRLRTHVRSDADVAPGADPDTDPGADTDDTWFASAVLDDHLVELTGRGILPAPLALERVTDVEPYILGTRTLRDERRRRDHDDG